VKADRIYQRGHLEDLFSGKQVYVWGHEDGSDKPMRLTPPQYVERFVLNRDFRHADEIHFNEYITRGNTKNNIAEVYPGSKTVEYFIRPSVVNGAPSNDWVALTFIFENAGHRWYLVGIVHDQWT